MQFTQYVITKHAYYEMASDDEVNAYEVTEGGTTILAIFSTDWASEVLDTLKLSEDIVARIKGAVDGNNNQSKPAASASFPADGTGSQARGAYVKLLEVPADASDISNSRGNKRMRTFGERVCA